jgi:hypothetical protein
MFRFTIRDVLWLMVVVGLAIGWWMDRNAPSALHDRLELIRAADDAGYHFQRDDKGGLKLLPFPSRQSIAK